MSAYVPKGFKGSTLPWRPRLRWKDVKGDMVSVIPGHLQLDEDNGRGFACASVYMTPPDEKAKKPTEQQWANLHLILNAPRMACALQNIILSDSTENWVEAKEALAEALRCDEPKDLEQFVSGHEKVMANVVELPKHG